MGKLVTFVYICTSTMRGQQQYCNGNIKISNTSIKSITTAAATAMIGSLTWILHVNHLEVELLKELPEVVIIRLGALKRHGLKSSRKHHRILLRPL